jgi:hypothetical protein
MAGMIKSMFGKTVSELTAERQKRTDAIIRSIMSSAGNTQYDQGVARLGASLGVWGGTKLGNWFSGGDKRLEAAEEAEALQKVFNERLATGDHTDPVWLRGTANIKFRRGDEAGGNQYEGLAKVQDKRIKKEAYYDSIPDKELDLMIKEAGIMGNYPLQQDLNSSQVRRAEKAVAENEAQLYGDMPSDDGSYDLSSDGSFDLSGEIGSNYIKNAPSNANNEAVVAEAMAASGRGETISQDQYIAVKASERQKKERDDEKRNMILKGKQSTF